MEKISTLQRLLLPVTLIVIMVALTLAYLQSNNEIQSIRENAEQLTDGQIRLLNLTESIVGSQVTSSMHLLKYQGFQIGQPGIDGVTALNNTTIPNLAFGRQAQLNNSALVDWVTSMQGGTATLFVKSGDDFIRIATNIKKTDKDRAIGTSLDPHGKAIKEIRLGRPFYGIVDILGNPYITGYEPMYDKNGQLIGIWYVGFEANIHALKESVEKTKFLESGFSAMIDEHDNIRFLSEHINPKFAQSLLTKRPSSWEFVSKEVPSWGFKVIYAYPKSEARSLGLVKGLYVLFGATIMVITFMVLFTRQIKKLIIQPIGGDPAEAIELIKRITHGDLNEDGRMAKQDTLIADMIKMRQNLRAMMNTLKQNSENLSLAASVFEHTHDGIFITDSNINIIQVNPAFERLTGFSREEALGKNPRTLHFAKFNAGNISALIADVKTKGEWHGEIKNKRKNGQKYVASLDVSTVLNAQGKVSHYLGVFSDITVMKQQQESLEKMAYHDSLTKLPNRALFSDRLNQAIAQSKRSKELFSVCYLDLNGFKPINDELGHEAGDQLLVKLAQRIRESMRSGDTVARFGGDEFAMLFCNVKSEEEAMATLQRILDYIKAPYMINNQEVRVSASAGMVMSSHQKMKPSDILRCADQAMYIAKASKEIEYHIYSGENAA